MGVKMEWFEEQQVRYGKFTFTNESTDQSNENVILDWKQKFAKQPKEKFILVWDCIELDDYESTCRMLLQETVQQTIHQIDRMWIISNPEITKAVPYLINFFEGINFKMIGLGNNIYKISRQPSLLHALIN